MSDDDETEMSEDQKYEYDLMMETSDRLSDLAMALTHYDDELAKQSLALALGTLSAHYDEPCLHQLMDLATAQMEAVQKHIDEVHGDRKAGDDDDSNGGNGNNDAGNN